MSKNSENNVHFRSFDGLELQGTYTQPADEIKGSMLLVHGITSNREEWGFFTGLAEILAKNQIASLRIDYRCHGVDVTPFEEFSMFGVLNDIDSAFRRLKELDGDSETARYIMGCSFGGGLCAYWAKRNPGSVEKVFLCYPVIDYTADLLKSAGPWEDALNSQGYVSYGENHIGRSFINELPYVDTIDAVVKPTSEIVIIHGDKDSDVPIDLSIRYCSSDKCRLIPIKGAEHGFCIPGDFEAIDPRSIENFHLVYQHVVKAIPAIQHSWLNTIFRGKNR